MTEREAGELAGKLKMLAGRNRLAILMLLGSKPMASVDLTAEVKARIEWDLKLLTVAKLIERTRYCGSVYYYSLTAEGKEFRDVIQGLIEGRRRREHEAPPTLDPPAEIQAGEAAGPGDAADGVGLHPAQ